MASWSAFEAAAPELAARVRQRFQEHGLALIATLRRDGSPRISGIEVEFVGGELWFGMMPGSRKLQDLMRDPRLALHAATIDREVRAGDAKVSGRGVFVPEGPEWEEYVALRTREMGDAPESWVPMFRVDVAEASFVQPVVDRLVIEWWREGEPVRRVERQ
ncbi:MAG TPA: pyridoxamine 5'-phosphate oxidase family protein [Pseudonocardiaceae bacterium]